MKQLLAALLSFFCISAFSVNVDIRTNHKSSLEPIKNCTNPSWLKPNKKSWVRCSTPPATAEWQTGTFVFKPLNDCNVTLVLEGDSTKPVCYRNVSAVNMELRNGNFASVSGSRAVGWNGKYKLASLNGKIIYVGSRKEKVYAANGVIPVKANQEITISFEYRLATEQDGNAALSARVEVLGNKLALVTPLENCFSTTWIKAAPKSGVRCTTIVPGKEKKQGKFSLRADNDCHMSLVLGKSLGDVPLVYTNVSVEGSRVLNGNFKAISGGKIAHWNGNYLTLRSESGNGIYLDKDRKYAVARIALKKGTTITVHYEFRFPTAEEIKKVQATEPKKKNEALKSEFRSGNWRFAFDKRTGSMLELSQGEAVLFRAGNYLDRPLDMITGQGRLSSFAPFTLKSHSADPSRGTLKLVYCAGDWEFTDKFFFGYKGAPNRLRRVVSMRSLSKETQKFNKVFFSYPLPGDGEYFSPGTFLFSQDGIWNVRKKHIDSELNRKGRFSQRSSSLVIAHYNPVFSFRPDNGKSIVFFPNKMLESNRMTLSKTHFHIDSHVCGWAEPGVVHQVADFVLETSTLPLEKAVKKLIHPMMNSVGAKRMADTEDYLQDLNLYGMFMPRMRNATIPAAAGELARIKEMGFNAIWFPPLQDGTVSYSPLDFYTPETATMKSWDEFRKLVRDLRKDNVYSFLDIVPHGGTVPQLIHRPVSEHGLFLSGRPADFNSPEWNGYMAKVATFYAEMGLQGFRIDAPAGSMISNWRRKNFPAKPLGYIAMHQLYSSSPKAYGKITPEEWDRFTGGTGAAPALGYKRASGANSFGGSTISKTIRKSLRNVVKNGATILETHGFPHSAAGDSTYDILFRNLPYKYLLFSPEEFTRRLTCFLAETAYTDIEGSLYMRNLNCNDDRVAAKFAGSGLCRPLWAVMYFCHGFPLGYSDSDFGHAVFLKELNRLRSAYPVLRRGKVSYSAEKSVMYIKRLYKKDRAEIAINFAGAPAGKLPPFGVSVSVNGKDVWSHSVDRSVPAAGSGNVTYQNGRIKGDHYEWKFDERTGLPLQFDLVSMPGKKITPVSSIRRKIGSSIRIESSFTNNVKVFFDCLPDQVKISVRGKGASLVWKSANYYWQAVGESALLEDWVSGEFAGRPRIESSYHPAQIRSVEIDGLLFDSRNTPLAPGRQEICFFPQQGGIGESFLFPKPASPEVEIHSQFGGSPGIHLVWTPTSDADELIFKAAVRKLNYKDVPYQTRAGKTTLRSESTRFIIENDHYRCVLSRSGAVLSILDKSTGKSVSGWGELVLTTGNSAPLQMSNDFESSVKFLKQGNTLELSFNGCLRPHYKGNWQRGARYHINYRFNDAEGFEFNSAAFINVDGLKNGKLAFTPVGENWNIPHEFKGVLLPQTAYCMEGSWNLSKSPKAYTKPVIPADFDFSDVALRYSVNKQNTILQNENHLPENMFFMTNWRTFPTQVNSKAVVEMQFCDAMLYKSLPYQKLEPGKYNLTVRYSGLDLEGEKPKSREKVRLAELYQESASVPLPITISLCGTDRKGAGKSIVNKTAAQGERVSEVYEAQIEITEPWFAPYVKLFAKPARGSRLFVESIVLERLK